jgi:class 3 adenylate cyclase/predicted ATPase
LVGLPEGTVTFLFTDIEGSSSRWDSDPQSMQSCLAIHNTILGEAIDGHGGHVVKTMGDGYMAVFGRPDQGIGAAVAAQRALLAADWGEGMAPLQVRMGVHTGNVDLVDGDYLGPDVNRSARIEAAGHGGQILVSAATKEMAAAMEGVETLDLGRHELRGLSRPERIYQVVSEGLIRDFPALRTAEAGLVRNAPLYHTSFVGREDDLVEIAEILSDGPARLLTLVGQGGAGKTRLAAEATSRVADHFAHGAVFCSLAAVESEDLVVSAIVDAIGFSVDTHSSGLDPRTQMLDYLRHRSILLVLDNFEQVLDSTDLVLDLLAAGDGVSVLVTSRERLRLSGETIFAVAGLDDGDDQMRSPELFVERAVQVDPNFEPDANKEGIRRICSALGGLPLGIELAAAWVDVLSPADIADEIESSLDFLVAQDRDRDERHRSLRAVFESSWNRLSSDQRKVLCRVAIFKGGFDRGAAEEVVGADLKTLSALVAKSLVRRPRPGRFDLHPLIGQFALGMLGSSRGYDEVEERHARFFVGVLRSERDRLDSAAQGEARDLLAEDVANLRTALLWMADHGSQVDILDVLEATYLFYLAYSWHEGLELFGELSARTGVRPDVGFDARLVSASVDATMSYLVAWVGDLDRAARIAGQSADMLEGERPGVPLSLAWAALGAVAVLRGDQSTGQPLLKTALDVLDPDDHASLYTLLCTTYGWSFYEEGDFDRADEIFSLGLRVAERTGATLARAYAISKLGLTAEAVGDHERAIDLHHEGREAFVKMGDPAGEAYTLSRLSWTYWRAGDYEKAREYALEGLFGFEQINHRWGTLATLSRLGMAELGLGELESAERHFHRLIAQSAEFTMPQMGRLYGYIGLAELAAKRGRYQPAAKVLAAFEADPETPKPFLDNFVMPGLERLKGLMNPEDFARAVSRGHDMSVEDIASVLEGG